MTKARCPRQSAVDVPDTASREPPNLPKLLTQVTQFDISSSKLDERLSSREHIGNVERALLVVGYLFSISLVAIPLTVYYGFFWVQEPWVSPTVPAGACQCGNVSVGAE
uniref:Uncharacterized protein n=1 Tax=Branchiostoma floridae TaxID=7739 RepID=C3YEX2_BRAFL|eukprot:XP_002605206.1 hypothetical protein BRAFLDRAFT_80854 [Branchiostoma floridae]